LQEAVIEGSDVGECLSWSLKSRDNYLHHEATHQVHLQASYTKLMLQHEQQALTYTYAQANQREFLSRPVRRLALSHWQMQRHKETLAVHVQLETADAWQRAGIEAAGTWH
jgi:hypothetical protein